MKLCNNLLCPLTLLVETTLQIGYHESIVWGSPHLRLREINHRTRLARGYLLWVLLGRVLSCDSQVLPVCELGVHGPDLLFELGVLLH